MTHSTNSKEILMKDVCFKLPTRTNNKVTSYCDGTSQQEKEHECLHDDSVASRASDAAER